MRTLKNIGVWIIRNGFIVPYLLLTLFYTALSWPYMTVRWSRQYFMAMGMILILILLVGVVTARIRGIWRFVMAAILIFLAGGYTWLLVGPGPSIGDFLAVETAPFAGITVAGIVMAVVVMHRALRLRDPRAIGRWAILGLMIAPLFYILHDDPPIENDFQAEDVVCNWPGAEESRKVLMTFGAKSAEYPTFRPPPGNGMASNFLTCVAEVENAWRDIEPGRVVIKKLSTFDRIADITDPAELDGRSGIPFVNFVAYRNIAQTYWAYAQLRVQQGDPAEGVRALVELHTVARKAVPDMALLSDKMIWVALADAGMEHAYAIVSDPQCRRETVQALRDGFPSLSKESVSFRTPIVAEYVAKRELFRAMCKGERRFDDLISSARHPLLRLPVWVWTVSMLPNATMRIQRTELDLDLNETPDTRWITSEFKMRLKTSPTIRNVGGWIYNAVSIIAFSRTADAASQCQIRSELLAIYLAERLGDTLVLSDASTGKPYERNAQGVPFSVGKDGKAGTADDVTLKMP